ARPPASRYVAEHLGLSALETNHGDRIDAGLRHIEVLRVRAQRDRDRLHTLDASVYALEQAQAHAALFLIRLGVENGDAVVVAVRHVDALRPDRHRVRMAAAVAGNPRLRLADERTAFYLLHQRRSGRRGEAEDVDRGRCAHVRAAQTRNFVLKVMIDVADA